MNISKKQLEGIGVAIRDARHRALNFQAEMEDSGRAAIAACAPILLGEPSEEEKAQMSRDFSHSSNVEGTSGWDNFYFALRNMFANRLRSLTAKPDARVDLVRNLMRDESVKAGTLNDIAVKIVAALDKEAAK